MNVSLEKITMPELESKFPTLTADQGWTPSHCQPLSTIAVIVPFRDREEHLRIFLNNLIPMLQVQNIAFHVFIIDQVNPSI